MVTLFGQHEDVALWRVQGTLTRERLLKLGDEITTLHFMNGAWRQE